MKAKRILLSLFSLAAGLLAAEVALRLMQYPRFYRAHSSPPQFFLPGSRTNTFYVNMPSSRIRFVYDGNPRGYFGASNEVDHVVNSAGFRGSEFVVAKPQRTLRIAYLGDSFTFGEGVRFEDTYAERTAALLRVPLARHQATCQSLNFGVSGYNTVQELFVLRRFALSADPDIVVVGYTLNDSEPVLFQVDARLGVPVRRPREHAIPEGLSDVSPPATILYRSRIAQLCWQKRTSHARTVKTLHYYRSLFAPDFAGWAQSREALRSILAVCRANRIACVVVIFPVLYQLNDRYPFADIHKVIEEEVVSGGGRCIDLYPLLKGRRSDRLWVHPTDPHPNEVVHMIAAEALADAIAQTPRYRAFVDSLGGGPSR